ncbi:MAG: LysE/ArgO family amino acid transporter [Corynebacterium sp.]|uniref:LysE/ArgO family amino acid transporter n=1 Tax=Corynebacterium sp. TaxID=1720 RepID=UPI0026DFD172|nr:LysE/ArgO family amino acid transporter [Corynebacterium sp.]MDO5670039.1 LysE/ArgO family amino acid transporter [Corynebacterium sp.]
MSIIVAGLFLGLSLIIAVGPQNIFLLKSGIKRQHVTAVVLTCIISDIFLITAGVAGVGVLVDSAPLLLEILRWGGAAYLLWFAWTNFRDAARPGAITVVETAPVGPAPDGSGGSAVLTQTRTGNALRRPTQRPTWLSAVGTTLALTWLNPLAYVDVVVMVGGIANQYGTDGRWLFALGAFIAALVWFPTVGYGAALLRKPLSRPNVWRWVNIGIGIVMCGLALKLVLM